MPKTLIWDFDGTIADSIKICFEIGNKLAKQFGYQQIDIRELENLKDMSAHKFLKKTGVSYIKLPFLVKTFRKEIKQKITDIEPFENIISTLIKLKEKNYNLGIVSSNSSENISFFLKKYNIFNIFDFIHSKSSVFGKSKVLNNLIKKYNLNKENIIYIGDETRDIEASKKINLRIISVSWGFNSYKILQEFKPDFIVEKPSEIIEILEK